MAQLQQQVQELNQKLNRNSTNSSLPPSSDPPGASPPVSKEPTGRSIGAQKGHPGHCRKLLPLEEVDRVVEHRPRRCVHCHAPLSPEVTAQIAGRHQVMELPERAVSVTEHQAYSVQCPCCHKVTRGTIPLSVRCSVVGERLSSALCLLSSRLHGSRRGAAELLQDVLGAPLSLGSVAAREREMSGALGGDYQKLKAQVQRSAVKNVDETGWKRAARFLWVAATAKAAVFHLDRGRGCGAMHALLGKRMQGVLCTDRFGPYEQHPPNQRQLCWSHLKRDFVAQGERDGPAGRWGRRALRVTHEVFELWHRFKQGHVVRSTLQRIMRPLKKRLRRLLEEGQRSGIEQLKGLCANLLRLEAALWTFVRIQGVEPTNNHAERMLRPAVQWRKKSLGSHSETGCRFAERMLSVIQTCRLRGASVIEHLQQTLRRHREELKQLATHAIHPPLQIAA
jgi:transposase